MHRHGYKGKKFGRERDQRQALMKGLAESLIKYESIETTLPKAKELVAYTEKLVTKAKKGDLHNRRQIIAQLSTIETTNKLVDEIAPKLTERNSGHFRIVRTKIRLGDATQMARVSFVDDLSKPAKKAPAEPKTPSPTKKSTPAKKPVAKKTPVKKTVKAAK